jgi:hypothetical protein
MKAKPVIDTAPQIEAKSPMAKLMDRHYRRM